jgi:hypothetical protein
MLAAIPQRQTFHPDGGDIGKHQRMQERSLYTAPAMSHQISLKKARLDLIPIGKSPYRHLMLEERARLVVLIPRGASPA